jgi:hypothetical protein
MEVLNPFELTGIYKDALASIILCSSTIRLERERETERREKGGGREERGERFVLTKHVDCLHFS